MELKELETRKAELIECVESWRMHGEEGQAMQALIIKLLKGTECTDPDFADYARDEDGTAESILTLDLDCYSLADFVKWLADHDFDLEEFNSLEDEDGKADYIKDHFDGLLYSDETLVISW